MKRIKTFLFIATSFVSLCSLGSFSVNSKKVDATENVIDLTGVQVRGDADAQYFKFLVLKADEFSMKSAKEIFNISSYNTTNKIKIYTSNNSMPVTLSTITDNKCQQNIWTQPGLFININDTQYETYNGATVYKVLIESGCQIPIDGTTYVTDKDFIFKNLNYGNVEKKYSAFDFSLVPNYTETSANINGIQLRGESAGTDENFFVIRDERYLDFIPTIVASDIDNFNVLNKVKFFVSKEDATGTLLADIVNPLDGWVINQWMSGGIMFRLRDSVYNTYNGSTVFAVELIEELTIPCQANKLVLVNSIKFYNNNFGVASAKYEAFDWGLKEPHDPINIETVINGVEVRGSATDHAHFLNLRCDEGASSEFIEFTPDLSSYNLLDNVVFYENKSDATGTLLRDIYDDASKWYINVWDCHGVMIPLKESVFESKFNGSTTYGVEIKEDTTIPFAEDYLTNTELKFFVNNQFENDEYKYNGFAFSEKPKQLVNFGKTEIKGLQNRANDSARWLMITVSVPFASYMNVTSAVEDLNFLDKVEIYYNNTEKPVKLRDIEIGIIENCLFTETTTLGVRIDTSEKNQGPKMLKVCFEKGCEVPYFENGKYGYRVLEQDFTLQNLDYGKSGDIFKLYDEDGFNRTYEQWDVNWMAVSTISFIVEGIEGLSFDNVDCFIGAYIDLNSYIKEGYDLNIISDNGSRIYQGFYPDRSSITLTLKYTKSEEIKSEDPAKKKGCKSSLLVCGGLVSSLSLIGAILLKKRKGELI